MKLHMRKAKAAREVVLKKEKKHHDDDDDDDDEYSDEEGTLPDRTVTSDDSSETSPSDESNNTPDRWHRVQVKGEDDKDGRFPRSFALDFPEEPFASIPETPAKEAPSKEPVWKKRLRHLGKSPNAKERKPLRINEDTPSSKPDEKETVPKEDNGHSRQEEESHEPGAELKTVKLEFKSVSFDRAGIEASRKTRKKQALRRKQEKILETFDEEESFDQLMRTESSYSDVFFNLFEEEDFSLATPTIYTDDGTNTDESSVEESSYDSGDEKPKKVVENEHADEEEDEDEEDEEEQEVSHREHRMTSRALSPREDYYEDDDFDFSAIGGCQSAALFEELKMITELFIPDQRCICAKPEEEIEHRGRSRQRKALRSRLHS